MIWRIEHHPRFKRLANYLSSKAPPAGLPGRQHIDPLEIPDLLPHLMLIDVVPAQFEPARYHIRLVGTEVVDGTGRYVEEVLTAEQGRAEIICGYDEIVRTRQPEHRSGVVATHGREHVAYERIAFSPAQAATTLPIDISSTCP
jgi:PAS domain-containing protein